MLTKSIPEPRSWAANEIFAAPTKLVVNSSTVQPIPSGSLMSTLMSTSTVLPTLPTLSMGRIEMTCSPSSKFSVVSDVVTSLQISSRKICTYAAPDPLPSSTDESKSEIMMVVLSLHSSPSPIVGDDIVGAVLSIPMNMVWVAESPEASRTVRRGLYVPSAIAPVFQSQPYAIVPGPSSLGVPGPGTFARLAWVKSSSLADQAKPNVPFAASGYQALSIAETPLPTPVLDSVNDVMIGTWLTILNSPLVYQIV